MFFKFKKGGVYLKIIVLLLFFSAIFFSLKFVANKFVFADELSNVTIKLFDSNGAQKTSFYSGDQVKIVATSNTSISNFATTIGLSNTTTAPVFIELLPTDVSNQWTTIYTIPTGMTGQWKVELSYIIPGAMSFTQSTTFTVSDPIVSNSDAGSGINSGGASSQTIYCSAFIASTSNGYCNSNVNKNHFSRISGTGTNDCASTLQLSPGTSWNNKLCSNGATYSNLVSAGSDNSACTWTCTSPNLSTYSSSCSFIYNNSSCGSVNGSILSTKPTDNTVGLCNEGSYATVGGYSGSGGRWTWTCTPKLACNTDSDYSPWGVCIDGVKKKTILATSLGKCIGQDIITNTSDCVCTSCGAWATTCSNGSQACIAKLPTGCTGGSVSTTRTCGTAGICNNNEIKGCTSGTSTEYSQVENTWKCASRDGGLTSDQCKYVTPACTSCSRWKNCATDSDMIYSQSCESSLPVGCASGDSSPIKRSCLGSNLGVIGGTILTDGSANITWNPISSQANFSYYKIVRSAANQNPIYPNDNYIYYTTNRNINHYLDSAVPTGNSYYRVCSVYENTNEITCSGNIATVTKGDCPAGTNCINQTKANGSCPLVINAYTTPTATCIIGTPSSINGTGPWTWTCAGISGGAVSGTCTVNKSVDATCPATTSARTAPTATCIKGTASPITETTDSWIWACSGYNGGIIAGCSVEKIKDTVNGKCGFQDNTAIPTISTVANALCSQGTLRNIEGTGPWSWTCVGLNNGTTANCSATKSLDKIDGVCGSAKDGNFIPAPAENLCSKGTPSTVYAIADQWNWNCQGLNSGSTVPCSANKKQLINGACGSSNGKSFGEKPTMDLCTSGTASSVLEDGSWIWTCSGAEGGTSAKCSATKPSCSWTCSNWGLCLSGRQSKVCKSSPAYCIGENPNQVERSCEILPNCEYAYSDWGKCEGGKMTRTVNNPENCITGLIESLTKDCDSVCAYRYSEWGECTNGTRKRGIASTYPDGCIGGVPIIQESCDSRQLDCTEDKWTCESWSSCSSENKQSRNCYLDSINDCQKIQNNPPKLIQDCQYIPSSSGNGSAVQTQLVTETQSTTETQLSKECVALGINNGVMCGTYLRQMNISVECKANNYLTKESCRGYLNRYGNPIACEKLSTSQCESLINNVILADFKESVSATTTKDLTDSVGKSAVINTNNNTIQVKESEAGKTTEIKMNELPLASSNNNVSVTLTAIKTEGGQSGLSPVAIIFDANGNGIPDDLEKRLEFSQITSDNLTGVDKAIIDGKSLEQPKLKDDIKVSASLGVDSVTSVKNTNNLRFAGKASPNQIVTVFIYSSMPIIVTVKSDENGNWIYDLDKSLVNGKHEVYVAINNDEGKIVESSVPELFFIAEARAVTMEEFVKIEDASSVNTMEKSDSLIRTYVIVGVGFIIILLVSFLLIKKIASNKYE